MRRNNALTYLLIALAFMGTALAPRPVVAQEKPPPADDKPPAADDKLPAVEQSLPPAPDKSATVEEQVVTIEEKTAPRNPWFVTLFGGQYSGSQLLEIPARLDLKDAWTLGLSVSKQFAQWTRFMRWELELQTLKHFGEQEHWEFTGSVNLRWMVFPWNRYVETTAAIGEGLSWATEIPALEKAEPTNSENAQLLNYLLLELTVAPPESSWSLATRIHHRSGVFGVFGHSGSNVLELGVRHRF